MLLSVKVFVVSEDNHGRKTVAAIALANGASRDRYTSRFSTELERGQSRWLGTGSEQFAGRATGLRGLDRALHSGVPLFLPVGCVGRLSA